MNFFKGFVFGFWFVWLIPYIVIGLVLWQVAARAETLPVLQANALTFGITNAVLPVVLGFVQWAKVKRVGRHSRLFWAYHRLMSLQATLVAIGFGIIGVLWFGRSKTGPLPEPFNQVAQAERYLPFQLIDQYGPRESLIIAGGILAAFICLPILMKAFGNSVARKQAGAGAAPRLR